MAVLMFKNTNGSEPFYATTGSAGFDICSNESGVLEPGEYRAIPTGLYLDETQNPTGCELQIRPRSGLALKHGVTVLNAPGTVDQDYTDEIKVVLINLGKSSWYYGCGDRIAQGVVCRYEKAANISTKEARRNGGFGSTGVNQ